MTRRDERINIAARLLSIALGISRLTGKTCNGDVVSGIWDLTEPGRRDDLLGFLDQLAEVLTRMCEEGPRKRERHQANAAA